MGTNYYLHEDVCAHCGRGKPPLHIGKSSAGWCFSLHVIPEEGLGNLDTWIERWCRPKTRILDEYGAEITALQMLEIITKRGRPGGAPRDEKWYRENHARPGPNGLARHILDGRHCVAHGEGTWDMITGEFS